MGAPWTPSAAVLLYVTALFLTSIGQDDCQALPVGGPLRTLHHHESFSALAHVPKGPLKSPLPVLLYLHGMGQSGDDLLKTLEPPATGGPPAELHHGRAVKELAEDFVMIAPQTNSG